MIQVVKLRTCLQIKSIVLPTNVVRQCNRSERVASSGYRGQGGAEYARHEQPGQPWHRAHRVHHVVWHQLVDLQDILICILPLFTRPIRTRYFFMNSSHKTRIPKESASVQHLVGTKETSNTYSRVSYLEHRNASNKFMVQLVLPPVRLGTTHI